MTASRRDLMHMLRRAWKRLRKLERAAWDEDRAPDRAAVTALEERIGRLMPLLKRALRERAHIPFKHARCVVVTAVDRDAGTITCEVLP
jgi:hypothetical protein